jgi:hypothetical protein
MSSEIDYLLSTQAIRDKASDIYELTEKGDTHFELNEELLPEVAQRVARITRKNYPSLEIPYHSRWGHFRAAGDDRVERLREKLGTLDIDARARAELDLIIVSVLLDAGAGPQWRYADEATGKSIGRSEGLGLASFEAFCAGRFSSDPSSPYQVDAERLKSISESELGEIFQVEPENPLAGLGGRLELLQGLGRRLEDKEFFSEARPGALWDYWKKLCPDNMLEAETLLKTLLLSLGPIWPSRLSLEGTPLGDVWNYKGGKVPFHKLSQWLSYSLIDSLEACGLQVLAIDSLTGLAEYRNGGLFVDSGVLKLKDESLLREAHAVDSDLVVEWRSLTIALLEKLAPYVRKELGLNDLPLPKILEGGTWWAGREIAAEKRPDLSPPIKIQSDGTVF